MYFVLNSARRGKGKREGALVKFTGVYVNSVVTGTRDPTHFGQLMNFASPPISPEMLYRWLFQESLFFWKVDLSNYTSKVTEQKIKVDPSPLSKWGETFSSPTKTIQVLHSSMFVRGKILINLCRSVQNKQRWIYGHSVHFIHIFITKLWL